MKTSIHNILLTACVLALSVICFTSVYTPIRFDKMRMQREQAVKERLVKIRAAQEAYCKKHGTYADNMALLTRQGLLPDTLQTIPFSNGRHFTLTVSTQLSRSGKALPLMECSATYDTFLDGLDANAVHDLVRKANDTGRFPGLKIGSLDTPGNLSGNWE